jgi:methylglutaconyl-CoA hydratase
LLNNAPLAQKTIKQLIKDMSQVKINEDLVNYTAEITAKARSSEESRKGITAFLEKKKISW